MNDAWMAGLIEGEGHFGIMRRYYKSKKKGDVVYRYAYIEAVSTDEDVIRRLHEIAGCGFVSGPQIKSNPNHKPVWRWNCAKRSDVESLAERIRPYLLSRRRARLDEILQST